MAVVTNGTAVLGLGDIGPEAGLPSDGGQRVLFKEFGGVNGAHLPGHQGPRRGHPGRGADRPQLRRRQPEDIRSPECFEIERVLEESWTSPCSTMDQHGTGIVVTAALLNALKVVGKRHCQVKIVQNGPGRRHRHH